jgi:hypothetical protein
MNSKLNAALWHETEPKGASEPLRPSLSNYAMRLRGEAQHGTDSTFYSSWGRGKKRLTVAFILVVAHYPLSFWGVFSRIHYKTFYYKYIQMITYLKNSTIMNRDMIPVPRFLVLLHTNQRPWWSIPPFKKRFRTANRWNYASFSFH